MKKGLKKSLSVVLAMLLCASVALMAACNGDSGGSGGAGADTTFSYWISTGQDSSYYPTYRDNPAIQYMLDYTTYENENGSFSIDLEFIVPVGGSELDNFNTLLSTGEYADILDMARYTGSVAELYEEGTILDLTAYVEKYMPNYKAYLDANPELTRTATNVVDGELKYLQLYSYSDNVIDQFFCGFNYRRDWIVKYGKNPVDGSAFTGGYTKTNEDGTPNIKTWADNVVFPSGGYHPLYISDWEWMFDIFTLAMEDLNITDGYCTSLYYPGYLAPGDLASAFGGTGAHWFINKEGNAEFGITGDNFRVYLQAMNTWYKNGWIDKAFTEHASDMFYRIDDVKVRQGKVGLWIGSYSQLVGALDDASEPLNDGMIVFGAAQPINDIYGGPQQQNVEPYCMYQPSREGPSICITDKAADKDVAALCTFLDQMYTTEFVRLHGTGLSKEQYEETQNEMYTEYGLTDGAYYYLDDDTTKWQYNEILLNDGGTLMNAARGGRIFGWNDDTWAGREPIEQDLMNQWALYACTGIVPSSFSSQLSRDDAKTFSKIETQINEFTAKNVPPFINGSKDPFSDTDWEAFVNAINKYSPETNTQIYQALIDSLG